MSVEFSVLGPLLVRVDGHEQRIGGFTRRASLGFLLLNAGRVVPISELTEAVWPDGHPPTARAILPNVVSALRKAGLDLVTRKPGHLLRAEPDRVDLHRFRAGLTRAAAAPVLSVSWMGHDFRGVPVERLWVVLRGDRAHLTMHMPSADQVLRRSTA